MRQFLYIAGMWGVELLFHLFSAGVGRTGTIIAVNHVRQLLETNKLKDLNLYELVMLLRRQRSSCVQTVVCL